MYFHETEVVELGAAEEMIQDIPDLDNSEGSSPSKVRTSMTIYAADAE